MVQQISSSRAILVGSNSALPAPGSPLLQSSPRCSVSGSVSHQGSFSTSQLMSKARLLGSISSPSLPRFDEDSEVPPPLTPLACCRSAVPGESVYSPATQFQKVSSPQLYGRAHYHREGDASACYGSNQ